MSDLRIYECEQRSPEWYAARRGIVTASAVKALITVGPPEAITVGCPTCSAVPNRPCVSVARKTPTPIKTVHDSRAHKALELPPTYTVADSDTSRGLVATLAAERITDEQDPSFVNADMERGIVYEPVIRARYAELTGAKVREIGLAVRTFDDGARLVASPDGLVGEDGGIEIKAPRTKGHMATVLADEVPAGYMPQIQAALLVTGRAWWDYVEAAAGTLYVKRVYPDPDWRAAITAAVQVAERSIEQTVAAYQDAAAALASIDPYENPYDLEIAL